MSGANPKRGASNRGGVAGQSGVWRHHNKCAPGVPDGSVCLRLQDLRTVAAATAALPGLPPAVARRGRRVLAETRRAGGLAEEAQPAHADARAVRRLTAFMNAALRTHCEADDGLCWVQHNLRGTAVLRRPRECNALRRILHTRFRPVLTPGAWLSNEDIDRVMSQYDAALPGFAYLGTVPSDFLPGLVSKAVARGAGETVAFVMKIDPHDLPGSHWVAVFMDLDAGAFDYFDSRGSPPPYVILRFQHALNTRLLEAARRPLRLRFHAVPHQREDIECGMFAMFFILWRLGELEKPDGGVTDAAMRELRSVLFIGTRLAGGR